MMVSQASTLLGNRPLGAGPQSARVRVARVRAAGLDDGVLEMAWIAMAMFIALFAFGREYFGWNAPAAEVQLALFSAFVFGIISGYKVKG